MGKVRKNLVVYTVRHRKKVIYVGHGSKRRPYDWTMLSRYKTLGISTKPNVVIEQDHLTKTQALNIEAQLISKYESKHLKNKALFGSAGGLKSWNSGLRNDLRCRGGRPKGIPMSSSARKRISRAMRGRASIWMTGRAPWNKGLTKDNHDGLKRIAREMIGNVRGKRAGDV